jgi:hypothetical protein
VTPTFNQFLGIRTRKESCRRNEKASKEEIVLGVPETRPEGQGRRGGFIWIFNGRTFQVYVVHPSEGWLRKIAPDAHRRFPGQAEQKDWQHREVSIDFWRVLGQTKQKIGQHRKTKVNLTRNRVKNFRQKQNRKCEFKYLRYEMAWIFPSSVLLRSVGLLKTDVSGLHIGPIFKGQVSSFLLDTRPL